MEVPHLTALPQVHGRPVEPPHWYVQLQPIGEPPSIFFPASSPPVTVGEEVCGVLVAESEDVTWGQSDSSTRGRRGSWCLLSR